MAQSLRHHPATRPECGRTARRGFKEADAVEEFRRGAEVMNVIEARGLRKAFGTTIALDGVDLSVVEGRIVGLIGPNGAGKTTALNAILGLTPYQGQLRVLGRDPWAE